MSLVELNPIEVLQRIYDSEINARIDWFWDEGVEWRIGDDLNGVRASGNAGNGPTAAGDAIAAMCHAVVEHFPESDFAKWIAPQRAPSMAIVTEEPTERTFVLDGALSPESLPTNIQTVCRQCHVTFFTTKLPEGVTAFVHCPRGHRTLV